jgi:hypothetical protein
LGAGGDPDGFFAVISRASHAEIHCAMAGGSRRGETNIV